MLPHNPEGPSVSQALASPQGRAAGRSGSGWVGASSACWSDTESSGSVLSHFYFQNASLDVETIAFLSSANVLIIQLIFTDPLSH